ncbi:MAG TPA: hypothetical protein VK045_05365 [Ornithinicoccus sp.]|nr:hypothetical protein [Ornithinicoccus sp.]
MRLVRDGLLAAAGAAATSAVWQRLKKGGSRQWAVRWERTNHTGDPVTLLEGVALVAGTAGTALMTGSAWPRGGLPYAVASLGAGTLGAVDDLRQDTDRKGIAGHLRALAQGRVTTGALKIVGLAATGLASTAWADAERASDDHHGGRAGRRVWDVLVGGAAVAGAANLANLFDLRPGRALKVGVLTAVPLVLTGSGSAPAATTLGASLALLPDDLAGTSMLGDTGANPLGAVLGLAVVQRQQLPARIATLAVITGLTLASEKVSFTRVIESTPFLRALDQLGREVSHRPGPTP